MTGHNPQLDPEVLRERLADGFQQLADKDTAFRLHNADSIGELVAATEPNWPDTVAVLGALASDKTDGLWATIAKVVRRRDVATEGGERDPEADHKLIQALLLGLKERAWQMDNEPTFEQLEYLAQRAKDRDERMDENRARIKEHGIDPKELRASTFNKAKFVLQAAGCAVLVSPLSKNRVIKRGAMQSIKAGIRSGEVGERQFRRKVSRLVVSYKSGLRV